ncbi:MAG: hypothetical protein AABY42_07365 [Nitrospirota bacterium]
MFRGEDDALVVAERIEKYRVKHPDREEFLALLKELPEHIVNHYFTLLRLEKEILRKRFKL